MCSHTKLDPKLFCLQESQTIDYRLDFRVEIHVNLIVFCDGAQIVKQPKMRQLLPIGNGEGELVS